MVSATMTFMRHLASILLATTLLSTTFLILPDCSSIIDLAEAGEVEDLREELNSTKRELELVKEERDDYAQRLEDSTTILIIVLILLIGSYFVFYFNTRRAKIALLEYQKRMGIEPGARPRRRRRG